MIIVQIIAHDNGNCKEKALAYIQQYTRSLNSKTKAQNNLSKTDYNSKE